MTSQEKFHNLQVSALQMGATALGLKNFASQIIGHVLNGGKLDDAGITSIKAVCIRDFKNMQGLGMPIEQESEALNKALVTFDQFMDAAISIGRQMKE